MIKEMIAKEITLKSQNNCEILYSDPGIKLRSPLQADSSPLSHQGNLGRMRAILPDNMRKEEILREGITRLISPSQAKTER